MLQALLQESRKRGQDSEAKPPVAPRAPGIGRPRRPAPLDATESLTIGGADATPCRALRSAGSTRPSSVAKDANTVQLQFAEDGLTPDFLRHFCETDDLQSVQRLELQVDGAVQSVETLGPLLPSLLELKLTGSSIGSVRELGTGLGSLQVLWLGRCGLSDLGGIASMPCLRECYLPFNDVADLYPLSGHEALEVLDLEGNAVADMDEVASLWMCSQLTDLTLTGNPLCKDPSYSRSGVGRALPQLKVLDDVSVGSKPAPQQEGNFALDEAPYFDWEAEASPAVDLEPLHPSHHLLAAGLREAALAPASELFADEPDEQDLVLERLKQAQKRQQASAQQRAALENPWFSCQPVERTCTAASRPMSAHYRPSTALVLEDFLRPFEEAASDLTRSTSAVSSPLASTSRSTRSKSGSTTCFPVVNSVTSS